MGRFIVLVGFVGLLLYLHPCLPLWVPARHIAMIKVSGLRSVKGASMELLSESSMGRVGSGRPHTDVSKARISAANKGKVPWNKGLKHSEQTKELISTRTREACALRKVEEAARLGVSVDALQKSRHEFQERLHVAKLKGGLTEDGRQQIAAAMKRRWAQPGYKEDYGQKYKGMRGHTDETRLKISESVKRKWLEPEYRVRCVRNGMSEETKQKISNSIKEKWKDPVFRAHMVSAQVRSPEWRQRMSATIREKWRDPTYSNAVRSSLRLRQVSESGDSDEWGAMRTERALRTRVVKATNNSGASAKLAAESLEQRQTIIAQNVRRSREASLKATKLAVRRAVKSNTADALDLREILGKDLWFEEKMYRRSLGHPVPDDAALTAILLRAWSQPSWEEEEGQDQDAEGEDRGPGGDTEGVSGVETRASGGYGGAMSGAQGGSETSAAARGAQDARARRQQRATKTTGAHHDRADEDSQDAVGEEEDTEFDDDDRVEVYGEDGKLTGVYNLREFERMRQRRNQVR